MQIRRKHLVVRPTEAASRLVGKGTDEQERNHEGNDEEQRGLQHSLNPPSRLLVGTLSHDTA
jgi:hypothetical protein